MPRIDLTNARDPARKLARYLDQMHLRQKAGHEPTGAHLAQCNQWLALIAQTLDAAATAAGEEARAHIATMMRAHDLPGQQLLL